MNSKENFGSLTRSCSFVGDTRLSSEFEWHMQDLMGSSDEVRLQLPLAMICPHMGGGPGSRPILCNCAHILVQALKEAGMGTYPMLDASEVYDAKTPHFRHSGSDAGTASGL